MSFDRDLITVSEHNRSHLTKRRIARLNRPCAVINHKILYAFLQLGVVSDEMMH